MKKILLTLTILIFTLTACAPSMDEPVSSDDPVTPPTSDYAPSADDVGLSRGEVFIDSKDLLTMESFPLQFMLNVKGNLPTPCHQLRVAVSPPDSENKITVDAYSVTDPISICAQVLEPFEVNIPLGSFPTGHYTLWVDGEQIAEFDS